MASVITIIRKESGDWIVDNPVLSLIEFGFESDTLKGKFGDGVTPYFDLPYSELPFGVAVLFDAIVDQATLYSGRLISVLSGNVDDYDGGGTFPDSNILFIELFSDSQYIVSGLAGGRPGRKVIITNGNDLGDSALYLLHKDSGSIAANQFNLLGITSVVGSVFLQPQESLTFIYNDGNNVWDLVASSPVLSDWDTADANKLSYIKNKPPVKANPYATSVGWNMNQVDVDDPVAVDLWNEFTGGTTFTWTRGTPGWYLITCNVPIFLAGKVFIRPGLPDVSSNRIFLSGFRNSDTEFIVNTYSMEDGAQDNGLINTLIILEIYP